MRKYVLYLLIVVNLFANFLNSSESLFAQQYYYTTNVEHLFTHCLIAHPDIAFSHNNTMSKHYDNDCITQYEFKQILQELYKNNYILVDINKIFEENNGKIQKKKVKVPVGKKPIILSFDDVNYDTKKLYKGMVDKIALDENQNFCTLTTINGKQQKSYDNEFIPILENFIKKHPDFSMDGARATINVTGYDGILGYRTSKNNTKNRNEEIEKVKPIIKKLKQNGWTFASHSYGHYHMKKISYEHFLKELENFKNEVTPLIGETKIYVYPYGEWEVYSNGEISAKHKALEDYGFRLFCGVGMQQFFNYLPTKCPQKVLFMDRKVMDGNSLRTQEIALKPFFSTSKVYDYATRPSPKA
ncbi:MAG: polysaccharide deacetylase family protein [Clostridia bacterium]|nr:polysaccharide deacetylase family protein [Clostridia bacterium]